MKIDFGKWAIDNRKLVSFLVAVFIAGGALSYYVLPKLEDPELMVRQALVVAVYPGASAHEVELQVTDPLEKAIRQLPDVNKVESSSYADMCLILIALDKTVPEKELEQHWDILRRKVQNASLPDGVQSVDVMDDFGDVFGMFYAITGDGLSDKELSDYAEFIERELGNIDGVKRIEVYGKRDECINLKMNQNRMANLGVSPLEVIETLNGQSSSVYSGYFENGFNRIRISVGGRSNEVKDIEDLIVQGHEGDQLRIKDIAEVSKDYDEPVRNSMQYDGQRALGISLSAVSGVDVTKLGKAVDKRMEELKGQLPVGVEYHKVFFQPERVDDALGTFLLNLLETVVLVIIVLFIFMGWRTGVIVSYSLFVIVAGTIVMLIMFDGTLQRVSLGSFIIAMGMLVDNAIVIVDGIIEDRKRGLPKMEALTSIGRKTAMPLLGATLIAILAFLPIFLSPDETGIYVRDLFIVLAVSLLLSWVLALTHVPVLASRLLYTDKADDDKKNTAGSYDGRIYRLLRTALNGMLSHRWMSVGVACGLLAVCGYCYQFLPQAFFPDMEYDQLYMEYKLPEGNNYKQVQKDLGEIQKYLRTRPEVTHVTASTGGTPTRYNLVRTIADPSLAYGELIIDFTSTDALVENINDLQEKVSAMFPNAYVRFKRYNLSANCNYAIEAQFTGPDPAVLHQLADSCRSIMESTGAMRLLTTNWEPKVPMLHVNYNQPNARRQGISRVEVGTSLLASTEGIPVGAIYDGIHKKNIYVKCVDKNGKPMDVLDNASIFRLMPRLSAVFTDENMAKLFTGNLDRSEVVSQVFSAIPLQQITDGVEVEWEDPVVLRYNGQRQQRVVGQPAIGYDADKSRQIVADALAERLELPEGYKLEWLGEYAESNSAMGYLFNTCPLALVLMVSILIMLFKSYRIPVLLFCCIPMIFVGIIPAVLLSGKDFGFVAIVGALGLVGMMLKNGIVLVDEIRLHIEAGMDRREALIYSSLTRLRPVTLASLTTVLGMIPLLPDAMFGSMAATFMGGLIAGTIVVLLFIPVLYSLFYKIK